MPTKKSQLIIEHIVERFLNPKMGYQASQFKNISEILDLPLYALKGVSTEEAVRYSKVLGISTLRDAAKMDHDHPLNRLIPAQTSSDINEHLERVENILQEAEKEIGDMDKLRGTILISQMISQAWQKRSSYLKKQDTKVITIGLNNAGKTAILSSLGGKMGIDSLANLKPTKRVERRKIHTSNLDLFLWDFGGQSDYRELYIREPEKYFIGSDLIIYVIDMQDPENYQLSFDYFKQILDIMIRLSENPYVLCFLHKSDPDILNDPDFQLNLEYVKETLKELMKNFPFDYDIYVTSIYNFFTSEPKFSKYIKDVLRDQKSLNDPTMERIDSLSKILETTLNSVITLASSLGEQISKIDYRLSLLEDGLRQVQIQQSQWRKMLKSYQKQENLQGAMIRDNTMRNISKEITSTENIAPPPLPPPPPPSNLYGLPSQNDKIKEIEAKAIASRKALNETEQLRDKMVNQTNQTRETILGELQALFQKARK